MQPRESSMGGARNNALRARSHRMLLLRASQMIERIRHRLTELLFLD